ncbi:MAG: GNAT family N-acetyltransferase [Dehalococcoidales bacterium]|nr:GNAT family N-acetyltransferase [Dehalococcoidales bacterium]
MDATVITGSKVILREKSPSDAWDDYAWETDPELAHLDAAPLLTAPYSQYLEDYTRELSYYSVISYQFAVDTLDGKHIGNCSYYHINENKGEAELGIMIGNRDYWSKGYGADVVTTLLDYIFRETKLNRIYLKTLESNTRAQQCFRKCGFTPYGELARDGYNFLLMEKYRPETEG